MDKPKITYRGWPGHFICGTRCVFHLNTLIEYKEIKIVVSTIGLMIDYQHPKFPNEINFSEIGVERFYETMAFFAKENKEKDFIDADVRKEIYFDSKWAYSKIDDEWNANKGHIKVVEEITEKIINGKLNKNDYESEK